ncbi:MAG: hypothetical protein IH991_25920 [Planctomycetes bacterium]|nr:hypothetical protein [Planctomycetota bacterium]
MNNQLHDDWEKLFEQLPVDTTAREQHCKRLKTEVLSAYKDQALPRPQRLRLKTIGQILMRYKAPHWTAAAILVTCIILLAQTSSTPVFAVDEVVDNMVKARSARFDMTAKITGHPAVKMKAFYLEPAHFRIELGNGHINIADWQAGKMIGLDPNTKLATVINLVNVPAEAKDKMQMNQFEAIRESLRNAIADPDTKIEPLGKKELDGRKVVGFRFKAGPQPITLWADPKTKLPVRIEAIVAGPPQTEVVMNNYEFNVDLDKSLFSTTIPDGYRVIEADVDASPPTEKDFIVALKMCCKVSNEFPAGFDSAAIATFVSTYLHKQGIGKDKGLTAKQLNEVMRISRGFQFALTLPAESEAHYAGGRAKQGDAERAVFWYKPTDSTKYRVIYADFSVKESAVAPKVPGAKKLTP